MKKSKYRYLCEVADFMNEEFKLEGSKNRAVVMRIENKLRIVILTDKGEHNEI